MYFYEYATAWKKNRIKNGILDVPSNVEAKPNKETLVQDATGSPKKIGTKA